MLLKTTIVTWVYFFFGFSESADKLTITDATVFTCQGQVVVSDTLLSFKVKLKVTKIDINHKIIIYLKTDKPEKNGYCILDLTKCDGSTDDAAQSKCYCALQEDGQFTATVVVRANAGFNGVVLVAEHFGDELLLSTSEMALPKIYDEPSASLEVNEVAIALGQCAITLASEEPYRVQFCTKNLYKPDLSIFWKDNDPHPSHSVQKNCIRKLVPRNSNASTFLRFSYSDKCGRNQNYKCQLFGRSRSETSTLGPTTVSHYFYWFLPVPIVIVVFIIVSPMVFMLIKKGSCSSKDSDTSKGSSSPSHTSEDSGSVE